MSSTMHVVGIIPADDKYCEMQKIWELCIKAEVDVPGMVYDFFNGEVPDGHGIEVPIENTFAVEKWFSDDASGFEVDITKLPENVKIVRFYISC